MDATQKKQILERILKKIDRTREKIADMEEMTKPIGPENAIGRISRMDAINNKSVMEAALRTAKKEMDDLLTAQKKIDDPEFGLCRKCKGEIPFQRLLLLPGSTQCVNCAAKF